MGASLSALFMQILSHANLYAVWWSIHAMGRTTSCYKMILQIHFHAPPLVLFFTLLFMEMFQQENLLLVKMALLFQLRML